MARATPEQAAQRWQQGLQGAGQRVKDGVANVTEAPGAAAVRNREGWRQGVLDAEEKWARNTARVTVDEWKRSMNEIGIPRMADGAAKKVHKTRAFLEEFLPFQDRVTAEVKGMPKTTFQDRLQRMMAQATKTHEFKRGTR
jgi:hypothetical protein